MENAKSSDPDFLTIRQVAARLQVSKRSVWRWISDKDLIVHRHGRWTRVYVDELDRFLKLTRDA